MRRSLILAVSRNNIIGRDNGIPWRLHTDMQRFKRLTRGHHVIMGRRTHYSIGRALPGRPNIVLSRVAQNLTPGVTWAYSLGVALDVAELAGDDEVFVIGGRDVYEAAAPDADRVYITRVLADIDGDVGFDVDAHLDGFERVYAEAHTPGVESGDEHGSEFQIWDRRR